MKFAIFQWGTAGLHQAIRSTLLTAGGQQLVDFGPPYSIFRVVFLDGSNPRFWNFYSFLFLLMLLGWVLCGWPL